MSQRLIDHGSSADEVFAATLAPSAILPVSHDGRGILLREFGKSNGKMENT